MLSEKAIVNELKKPVTYNHAVQEPIRVIETNVSWVFLTGQFAYKMKKTIKFGDVLDFSTLQKRYNASKQEVELNKRLAPELYVGLVSFTSDKKIDGEGDVIEYLVKMKEIPQEKLLINLIQKNSIDKVIIEKIVEIISEFHKNNIYRKELDVFSNIFEKWDENFRTTQNYEDFPFNKKFADRVYNFMEKNRFFWDTRLEKGKIIDGHGDLQLRNIFIDSGKVVIFDCIEFNESLRIQDILEEISFLAMDLDYHNKRKEANYLLEKYLVLMNESPSKVKDFVNFYKSYRAYVRSKVYYSMYLHSLNSAEQKIRNEYRNISLQYLRLAKSYKF
ncbi:MAG: hypothetical protein K9W45_05265 [Candidatus Heimdallarchaeum aukensis]|uniref:Aminoglycoside phosphotransferase domain-containing protein n=1 Tax=Candidatus Heimdallarchaeum aukensis TaxID=2876573 RepID=A0A9Y1BMV0_9ARCH|nr:MAG: hypothetical protein K9W45_05265 [Candidatus Heimdallarchaeum aukensis]